MDKLLSALIACGLLASTVINAPSAAADVETRKTASYNGIKLNLPAELNITMGKNGDTTLDGDKAVLPLISVTIENGILVITSKKPLNSLKKLVINCSTAVLDRLQLDGACKANIKGLTKGRVEVVGNGASTVTAEGNLDWFSAIMSGAGTVKASNLKTKGAFVKISGAGTADLNVVEKLKVEIEGAGTVKYAGNPTVEKKVMGAGTITKI